MFITVKGRSALAAMSMLLLTTASAMAQQVVQTSVLPAGNVTVLDRLVIGVTAPGQAPATGTIGQPMASFSGGQVAAGTRLGMLGNRSVQDAPFSVAGFTQDLIRNQQARSVADVTLNDPSVRNDAPAFSERDAFFIRGFSVTNLDTAYDGLFYLANPRRHFLEGVERVEVIKGPTALLGGGTGRVGGTINLVPKRATDEPLTRLTTTYTSDSQLWSHLDVGRRFGANNELGVRINGSYRNGDTPYENNQVEVGVAALGIDYRGERLRASFDYNHSTQNIDAPTSLFNSAAAGVEIPDAPNGRINLASPFEYHDSSYNMAAGRVEFDVLPNATIYAAGGVSRYTEDFLTSSHEIRNSAGDAVGTLAIQPQDIRGASGEIGLRADFDTGPVNHQVNVAYSRSLNENYRGGFARLTFAPYATNIYDPVYLPDGSVDIAALPTSDDLPLFADLNSDSVAISDTLSFAEDRFQLTVGGRFQHYRSQSYNTTPGAIPIGTQNFYEDVSRFSPAIAASARVTDNISVYGNYVEALTQGPVAPRGSLNVGELFPAVTNRQREIGVKYDGGNFGASVALFEIEQPNGFTAPDRIFRVDGLQVNRGLEVSVFGQPFEGVRVLGGVTLMDAKLEQTTVGNEGNFVPGVPEVAFNLYGEYDLPMVEGLTLTGRLIYGGSTFYDQANTQEVDDWKRVDVGLRYETEGPFGNGIELKANVENLFDEAYWSSSARGYLAVGAPRTFKVSASVEF